MGMDLQIALSQLDLVEPVSWKTPYLQNLVEFHNWTALHLQSFSTLRLQL